VGLKFAYSFTDNWAGDLGVMYRNNQSNFALADYQRTVVSLGLNVTF